MGDDAYVQDYKPNGGGIGGKQTFGSINRWYK